jgi:hypothetical protein
MKIRVAAQLQTVFENHPNFFDQFAATTAKCTTLRSCYVYDCFPLGFNALTSSFHPPRSQLWFAVLPAVRLGAMTSEAR